MALVLVLSAAVIHATWNWIAKRAGASVPFTWLTTILNAVCYAPFALVLIALKRPVIGGLQLLFIAGTGVLHTGYFLLLTAGYRAGDLSVVYPLARGTGPMLATLLAIILFGERPTAVALAGTVSIGLGVMLLVGSPRRIVASTSPRAVALALLTGATIAVYTLWDKHAVGPLLIPPLVYDWAGSLVRTAAMSSVVLPYRTLIRQEWRLRAWPALAVGLLSPFGYILFLTALSFSRVSYVAPAREVSILLGTLMGTRLLGEADGRRRVVGAAAIVLGMVLLGIG